jgi:type VI secretion system protein ImpA
MLDVDALLSPIEEDNPAGPNLRYDPVYDKIKLARQEDPDLPQGEWKRERKVADWEAVIELSVEVLEKRSKDLQIAAWLTEGLIHQQGFSGLSKGLTLIRRLQEEFWDHLHPKIEEEDDVEFRAVPLEWVGQYLEEEVKSVPLNASGHSFLEYQESRRIGTEEDAEKDSSRKAQRAQAIADGKPTAEDFDGAFDATGKPWYKQLRADLEASKDALVALEQLCDERYGSVAPSFRTLREALSAVSHVADRLLDRKLEQDPDPPEEAMAPDSDSVNDGTPAAEATLGGASASGGPSTVPAGNPSSPPAARKIDSWDAACDAVAEAAAVMRREQPTNPAPYLMLRGLRWGELRAGGSRIDPRLLEAPPTHLRTRLKSLSLDGEWEDLVEAGEQLMATPYGRGWLDLQRYVLAALEELGGEYDHVAASIRQAIRGLLVDLPDLMSSTLMDDSPAANRETIQWLQEGILVGLDEEQEAAAQAAGPAPKRGSDNRGDTLTRALVQVRAGNPQRGIELLLDAATRGESDRERFLRRSEATQIMVQQGMEGVALPILREMMEQVERHALEDWEAGETVARTMALLYTCMDRLQVEPSAKQELYLRICRLDPMQGMSLESGGAAGDAGANGPEGGTNGDAGAE